MSSEVSEAIAALQESGLGVGMDYRPRDAAKKLAKLGGDEAVDALIHALHHHPNQYVRTEVAFALGGMSDPRVLRALGRAAKSDSSRMNVRPIAADAVQKIQKKQTDQ